MLSNFSSMEVYPKELQFEDAANYEPDHAALEFSLINNHPMSQVFMIKSTCVKHLAVSPTCGFIKALDQIKVIFWDGIFPLCPGYCNNNYAHWVGIITNFQCVQLVKSIQYTPIFRNTSYTKRSKMWPSLNFAFFDRYCQLQKLPPFFHT